MAISAVKLWALETANRVKMIQSSWSDDDSLSREETVRQELRRALDDFPRSERAARIAALGAYFPAWNQGEVKQVEVPIELPPRKLTSAEAVDLLVGAFPKLTDRERKEFSQRLLDAGFKLERVVERPVEKSAPVKASTEGMEFLPEPTGKKMGLKGQIRVYPTQVFNVLHELFDCLATVAATAQNVIQEIYRRADKGPINRDDATQMRAAIVRYLTGEPGGTLEQMQLAVSRVRIRLVGVWQLPGALPGKLNERLKPFQPEAILKVVEREDQDNGILSGLLRDRKVRCWEKYGIFWKQHGLGQLQESDFWEVDFARDVLTIVEGKNV